MEGIRLQKYFSDCSVMSRRAAEDKIKQGLVRVNGEIAQLGQRINPELDVVEYDGRRILPQTDEKIYILLNKPRGYVTTLSDEKGRKTVTELLSEVHVRVYPVGRLDMDSDGLLLLTNDGELTNKLTHPRHEIPKIYRVTVKEHVTDGQLTSLGKSMVIDGYKILPVETALVSRSPDVLEMKLYEGRNRQIRKMCEQVGLNVSRLCRIAIGDISLGSLEVGKWRYLTQSEIDYLKNNYKPKGNKNA